MPLNNFGWVGPNVYRSAQPDAESLPTIAEVLDVTVVLRLNTREEAAVVPAELSPHVRLWEFPMDMTAPPDAVTRALVAQMAGEIGARQVLLVHCTHGRDRTGFVCAAYQMLRRGYSLDAALAIRADYGVTGPFHTLMNHSFTQALKRLAQPEPQP